VAHLVPPLVYDLPLTLTAGALQQLPFNPPGIVSNLAATAGSLCCAFVGWLLLLAESSYIQTPNDAASTASECEGGQSLVVLTQLDEQLRPCALTAPLQP
jgi:hypothetical protein